MFGFKYTWLKILETVRKQGPGSTLGKLRRDLDARGFHIPDKELSEDLAKMRDLGLIEVDLIVSGGGEVTVAMDDDARIAITTAGARRVPAIVKV